MHVIDSHTGGEPTRVILDGGPDLGSGSLKERAERLARDHMKFCRSVLAEPRGQPAMVAALLVAPVDQTCAAGVIYFDRDAVLGMCGHGTIGLGVTLGYTGQIQTGKHLIETPAGKVGIDLIDTNTVAVKNIESRRIASSVSLEVDGIGQVSGDIAYGGNWFFITESSPIGVDPSNIEALTNAAVAIRETANSSVLEQIECEPIDHVIFQQLSKKNDVFGRNFVLCPDNEYDRSPCGTGCSAMLACLAADGRLEAGKEIVQESIIGSSYKLSYQPGPNGGVMPSITGQAFVMSEGKLLFDQNDPFRDGIGA